MKQYVVNIFSCHDATVFGMELTEDELVFLKRVARLCNKTSVRKRMPKMKVEELIDD